MSPSPLGAFYRTPLGGFYRSPLGAFGVPAGGAAEAANTSSFLISATLSIQHWTRVQDNFRLTAEPLYIYDGGSATFFAGGVAALLALDAPLTLDPTIYMTIDYTINLTVAP